MRLSGQAEVKPHVDINYYWRERMRVHVPHRHHAVGALPVRRRRGQHGRRRVLDLRYLAPAPRGQRGQRHSASTWWPTPSAATLLGPARHGRPPGPERGPAGIRSRWYRGRARAALDFETRQRAGGDDAVGSARAHRVPAGRCVPHPQLPALQLALLAFSRRWHALWSCYGESREGWPRYRALLETTWSGTAWPRASTQIGLKQRSRADARACPPTSSTWPWPTTTRAAKKPSWTGMAQPRAKARCRCARDTRGQGRRRSAIRPPGVHRQSAAFGLHPAVRNPGRRAGCLHHRRREPPADRRHPRTGAGAGRPRFQSTAGRGCDAGSRWPACANDSCASCAIAKRARRAPGRRAHAGEDPEERTARAVPVRPCSRRRVSSTCIAIRARCWAA